MIREDPVLQDRPRWVQPSRIVVRWLKKSQHVLTCGFRLDALTLPGLRFHCSNHVPSDSDMRTNTFLRLSLAGLLLAITSGLSLYFAPYANMR